LYLVKSWEIWIGRIILPKHIISLEHVESGWKPLANYFCKRGTYICGNQGLEIFDDELLKLFMIDGCEIKRVRDGSHQGVGALDVKNK
jgi:hypothetical protein